MKVNCLEYDWHLIAQLPYPLEQNFCPILQSGVSRRFSRYAPKNLLKIFVQVGGFYYPSAVFISRSVKIRNILENSRKTPGISLLNEFILGIFRKRFRTAHNVQRCCVEELNRGCRCD